METNIDSIQRKTAKNMRLTYGLVGICLVDWIYQLCRWIVHLDYTGFLDYFAHLLNLWRSNTVMTIIILLVCLLGVPKFLKSLQKTLTTLGKILKSLLKKPIIIQVPLYVYFFALSLKVFVFRPISTEKISSDIDEISFWTTIHWNLRNYRYSSLFTMVLFILGLYNTFTNRWTQRLTKRLFSMIKKQLTWIQKFVSITIPTPLSMFLLVLLNSMIHLFPNVSKGIYSVFSTSLALGAIGLLFILYQFYQVLYPGIKFDVNFSGDIYLNDVSKLNSTRIYSVFYPRTFNDIEYLVSKAKSQGKTISMRGQAHTMGGQTLPSRNSKTTNYVCDLKYLNRVEYNESTEEALVEAGATWTHVIKKLNSYGRSPVIMQSYCTFSVAGTISVNAHGITSDDAMYESVVAIEYIDYDGHRQECNREKQPELFSLMIGGYGLFGIIIRLRLKTVPNVKTDLEYIRLQADQFPSFYEDFLDDPTIEIKIARVDLVRPNNILMFIFRKQLGSHGTISELEDEARVMHPRQHLIYTYLVQHRLFRRIRFALEKASARPLDLTYSSDRNTTMYESAKPMALLYQPLTYYDDTFVLQEYFIPKRFFQQWYTRLIPIVRKHYQHLFLLNLTIRFVKKDQLTFLAYTKNDDCYAFVFYFRIKRNELGDRAVEDVHQQLITLALDCHGTFYLPYRQHYSYEQIIQAYPMIDQFFTKKFTYDPIGLFSNDWYEHYRPMANVSLIPIATKPIDLVTEPFVVVQQRRSDSFAQVINDEILRVKFRKFLRTVFNAEPVHVIFNYVNRATRNPANKNDNDIYRELQHSLKTRQFAFIRNLFALYKQIRQLREQIQDMLRQQINIFKQLGYCGKIKDIVSIGDGGRCINELRQILQIKNGRVYRINDQQRWSDVIEQNRLFPVGTFIPYDFRNLTDVPIPSESVDLVVCYMGLHHLPQDQLERFLQMVHRILRPNGLFLFREHHAYEQLKPLLDVAHMVFNVVTGVDYENEVKEIRAFRTIEQWRSCMRQAGFEDTFVYEEQEDDPTDDIMIVVRKPLKEVLVTDDFEQVIRHQNFHRISAFLESNYFRPCEWLVVRITMQFGQYLNHTPFYFFPFIKYLTTYWSLSLTETRLAIGKYGWKQALTASPGFMMNLVVGLFLSIAFLQLSFFSFLIRAIPGARLQPEYEQLILRDNESNENEENYDFQSLIDPNIDHIERSRENHLYSIRVPRHHVFTGIMKKLAVQAPNLTLLSVSEQTDFIQMEVKIPSKMNDGCLLWFKQRPHMEIIFEFTSPIEPHEVHLVVGIKVKQFLAFLRDCEPWETKNLLNIVQIYDHFD